MEPGGASSQKTLTNWLDLPRDLMIQIFIKVGVVDLLCSAQSVCSSWRAIARDPRLYCVIHIRNGAWKHFNYDNYYLFVKLATEAIDRSCGQAIEFSIVDPGYQMPIFYQLKFKTPGLKCLRLAGFVYYHESDEYCMIEVIRKLPLLEDVEFCNCYFSKEVIQVLGRSCPKLKSFRWYNDWYNDWYDLWDRELCTEVALAIAGNMNPTLRSLDLFGNLMNNTDLEAILDRFSQLEYLNLQGCVNLDLNGDLLKRCRAIKTLRLPIDSTKDVDSDYSDEDDDSEYSGGDSDKDVDDDSDYSGGDSEE